MKNPVTDQEKTFVMMIENFLVLTLGEHKITVINLLPAKKFLVNMFSLKNTLNRLLTTRQEKTNLWIKMV